jgi:hypothetical protein
MIDDRRQSLVELVSHETARHRHVTRTVVAGRAYREILGVADEKRVDLRFPGGAALGVFGSATQQVVRGASC